RSMPRRHPGPPGECGSRLLEAWLAIKQLRSVGVEEHACSECWKESLEPERQSCHRHESLEAGYIALRTLPGDRDHHFHKIWPSILGLRRPRMRLTRRGLSEFVLVRLIL